MRHRCLFLAFIIMVFCGGSGKLNAQERLNFAYISPNAGSSSVLWVAKDAGIFKKHGLDVNVVYIEGTPKALDVTLCRRIAGRGGHWPGGRPSENARRRCHYDHGFRSLSP